MARLLTFECAGIAFDVYDTDRIPVGKSKYKYFITPAMISAVEKWIKDSGVDKVRTREQMEQLISMGFIGAY
jgi:hypothetical protein